MRPYIVLPVAFIWLSLCGATVFANDSGPAVGSVAPDFTARNIVTHETTSLSAQQGKVVILTFFASWCPPCRRELPILTRAQQIVGKDKLTVFAVNHKETADHASIRRLASALQIDVMEDYKDSVGHLYSIKGIPHLFIISRGGKVLANHTGYGDRTLNELVADINHALADEAPVEPETPESAESK